MNRNKLREVYARLTGFYKEHDRESVVNSLRVVNHLSWLFGVEMNYYPQDNLSQWIEDGCPGEYDYDNDRPRTDT